MTEWKLENNVQVGFCDIKHVDNVGYNVCGGAGKNPNTGKWEAGFDLHTFDVNTLHDTGILIPRTFIKLDLEGKQNLTSIENAVRAWIRENYPQYSDYLN